MKFVLLDSRATWSRSFHCMVCKTDKASTEFYSGKTTCKDCNREAARVREFFSRLFFGAHSHSQKLFDLHVPLTKPVEEKVHNGNRVRDRV